MLFEYFARFGSVSHALGASERGILLSCCVALMSILLFLRFYELGPGTQLKGIMKRIDGKIADKMSNISV